MKYFKTQEFLCKCGCGKGAEELSSELTMRLDMVRARLGTPIVINSGYRCEKHNKAVGGTKTSSHTKGLAADIRLEVTDEILTILQQYFSRIGVGKNFIHVDVDNDKPNAIWYY